MPVYLRNFYYNELLDMRKSEEDQFKKAMAKPKPGQSKRK